MLSANNSKSTSYPTPLFDWLLEKAEVGGGRILHPDLGVIIFYFAFFAHTGDMASAHDRAVLQAIFNPTTPFGEASGLDQEEEIDDDGECECS